MGIHHRAATSKRPRRPAGDVVLDARTLQPHVLTSEAVAAARTPGGHYVATCGAEILPIAEPTRRRVSRVDAAEFRVRPVEPRPTRSWPGPTSYGAAR